MTQGYIIQAVNTDRIDYELCAHTLVKSLRAVGDTRPVTIVTLNDLKQDEVSSKTYGPYSDDWQVYELSPYDETFKLEADMIVTRPIDSWWTLLKDRDLHIASGCRDYKQRIATSRFYRYVNDKNNLPDLYNGITYFKKSTLAGEFFQTVREIFKHWSEINQSLNTPSMMRWGDTDTVYAIAAHAIGVERCTLPNDSIQFVHMKQKINQLLVEDWTRECIYELVDTEFRINTVTQLYPVHYHVKTLAAELGKHYDNRIKV